jgi:hypothetical protein
MTRVPAASAVAFLVPCRLLLNSGNALDSLPPSQSISAVQNLFVRRFKRKARAKGKAMHGHGIQ